MTGRSAGQVSAGHRFGAYTVEAPLGAGGMGEVYRAHDTKLGRKVAIKILPRIFASDPDRLARFAREARALASLNHPHVGAIYGVEDWDDVRGLVLELVEGDTLAERLQRGPMPLAESLRVAQQIAEALQAAHERGIIHRDLKPGNIKITPSHNVKVLDFGLAKAVTEDGANADRAAASAVTAAATHEGVILGTPAYMSPEQARGEVVDRRADLWAFGAVIYEVLAGRPAFPGPGVPDTLAQVLTKEPDWTALPAATPAPLRKLLRRCLEKDRRRRLDSATAVKLELDDLVSAPNAEAIGTAPSVVTRSRWLALIAGAALATAVGLAVWLAVLPVPALPDAPSRFTIVPSPEHGLAVSGNFRDFALSPDGRQLVYRSGRAAAGGMLMVRALDQLEARPLPGVTNALEPFFSPDSRSVGFFDGAEIRKVSLTGGAVITVCRFDAQTPAGATWGEDNSIIFATTDVATGLWRVPADGGTPLVLTTPDVASREGDHRFPSNLPGSRGVLYTVTAARSENSQVAVLDLKTGERKVLVRGGSHGEYVDTGHIVYAWRGTLHAVPFDLARLAVVGEAMPVLESVHMTVDGRGDYGLSRTGTLAYVTEGTSTLVAPRSLTWVDRAGREQAIDAPPHAYLAPRVSPDGSRIAVEIREQGGGGSLWMWDIVRETLTPFGRGYLPTWMPDSRRLVFQAPPNGGTLYRQAAAGTGSIERLTTNTNAHVPTSVTPDGTRVVGYYMTQTSRDLFVLRMPSLLPLSGDGGPTTPPAPEPLVTSPAEETNAEVSPDGRYVAYQSDESGRSEVYLRTFPDVNGGRWTISRAGGSRPAWARTGRELFYLDAADTLTAVSVSASAASVTLGTPTKVFDTTYTSPHALRSYDVSPGGQKFLMMKEPRDNLATPASLVVVLHWSEELKARMARGK